jgi:sortase A
MSKGKRAFYLIGFLVGFVILMYPTFSDLWNRYRSSLLVNDYEQKVAQIDTANKDQILADARAYNEQHTVNTVEDAFDTSEDYILTHPYDQLLNPNGDEVMGSIEIPKINVDLAIYHGTGTDSLEKGVGHVQGTSLPVGGANTHAVLAAHRGLANAKLFTDLDQMEIGDKFFLHILGDTLAYEVDQILVVEPDDMSALEIEQGQDLVTLLTCTPYGVNTQRLLVRGHRIPYSESDKEDEKDKQTIHLKRDEPVRFLAAGLMAVLIVVTIIRGAIGRHDKKKQIKKRKKE